MLKKVDDIAEIMEAMGRKAREAASVMATAEVDRKHAALVGAAEAIRMNASNIMDANAVDIANGKEAGMSEALLDRLNLTKERVLNIANSVSEVAELRDPIGEITAEWTQPNGLKIQRVRTPLGVIGIIYESRPNVTADAGALCLKAGNAVILRGGSDSIMSATAIHECLTEGLKTAGLPTDAIQFVATTDREAVSQMTTGLNNNLDVLVLRGGKSMVANIQAEARIPVFAHLEGVCHVYVDRSADLNMAVDVTVNSKMRRTSVCGAAETLLIDKNDKERLVKPLVEALAKAGCAVRGDDEVVAMTEGVEQANESDWVAEYLDSIIAVRLVDGVNGAVEHIKRYSSNHTESIIAEDEAVAEVFHKNIDSAILLHNASTQFADGGEFGMGAEIGIATGKMHARGPVGVEQLTSFKYCVHGNGQTRS